MIKLKNKVNKSAIMRELHNEAVEMYKNAYEGEYAIEQFLYGAEKLFEKLRQCDVGRCNFSEHYGEFWAVVENLVDDAISNMDDFVKAYVDDNGEVKFEDTLLRENLIDMNDLCEDLVKSDGIGHYLAEYDGKDNEYKLSGIKYYLYRI